MINKIKQEISKAIVGGEDMINALLIGLISDGHILLEGVPGLAKTTTINALAASLGLDFKRVQFTPDLLPSDIIGAEVYNPKTSDFMLKKGPVFTNLLLADEINRAPAKVQSALLEAMQERQVTIGNESFKLSHPFLVLATQNPIEQEGAYSLPEAQLDRFMMRVMVNYGSREDELAIIDKVTSKDKEEIKQVASLEDINDLKTSLENIYIDKEVEEYIVNLIFASRYPEEYGLGEYKEYIEYGASPRASIDLHKVAKATALLEGKDFVTPVSVAKSMQNVLVHRIITTYEAEASNVSKEDIINAIVEKVNMP